MLFLFFTIPIGLIATYLCVICVRQKYVGAALLMAGTAVACAVFSVVMIYGLLYVKNFV